MAAAGGASTTPSSSIVISTLKPGDKLEGHVDGVGELTLNYAK